MMWLAYLICGLLLFAALILFLLHCIVNDHSVPVSGWAIHTPHTLLAVFAHPDDEVMVAGTLAGVKRAGGQVHMLYLTHGEDGPTGNLVPREKLGVRRAEELQTVKRIIGADTLEILDYPDRYLSSAPKERVQQDIAERIAAYHPDTVLCFDSGLGLYGHADHAASGLWTQEILRRDPMGVENLLVMTLPKQMIALALRVSSTFQKNYKPEIGLPQANFAVKIRHAARQKSEVVRAHKTQWQVMGDVQPLYDKIPYVLYYRIFSREYFERISLA